MTGAAGGIGAAVCERLRSDGYRTIGLDIDRVRAADIPIQIDLRDLDELAALARQLSDVHDVSAIVHNAAVQPIAATGQTSTSDWLDTLRVNVVAVDALVSGARLSLDANHGAIVVVSSVHAHATTGGIGAYAASKAALEGWVRSAALDLGPNIRVNAVSPGAIDTPKLRQGFSRWGQESAEQRRAILLRRTALARIGEPSEVAAAISFLLNQEASFITGSVLLVDGGASARLGTE
ncbi:SDR family NAD(P)-dependent oxidoreductase [Mycolicibacterium parafortuitum]|uniref:SDR family NAD(P)-dependent oxidoreductase n=1 Tax=Mycolicibacterium parafortuitum TaxID=39692 RepID=UPI0023533438|nr:SDR family oxidoreductase [Mycolicibacterium parafortuitum]